MHSHDDDDGIDDSTHDGRCRDGCPDNHIYTAHHELQRQRLHKVAAQTDRLADSDLSVVVLVVITWRILLLTASSGLCISFSVVNVFILLLGVSQLGVSGHVFRRKYYS